MKDHKRLRREIVSSVPPEKMEEVQRMWAQDLTYEEIGEVLWVTKTGVKSFINRHREYFPFRYRAVAEKRKVVRKQAGELRPGTVKRVTSSGFVGTLVRIPTIDGPEVSA